MRDLVEQLLREIHHELRPVLLEVDHDFVLDLGEVGRGVRAYPYREHGPEEQCETVCAQDPAAILFADVSRRAGREDSEGTHDGETDPADEERRHRCGRGALLADHQAGEREHDDADDRDASVHEGQAPARPRVALQSHLLVGALRACIIACEFWHVSCAPAGRDRSSPLIHGRGKCARPIHVEVHRDFDLH